MVKVLILTRRRPDVSREEFERHLRETHLPLVARLPGLRRLVVNTVLPNPDRSPLAWDAIGEDWFESREALRLALASPAGQAVLADSARFTDPAGSHFLVVEEDEVALPTRGEVVAAP